MNSRNLKRRIKSVLASVAGIRRSDVDEAILPELLVFEPYTMCDAGRMNNLHRLAKLVAGQGITGDVVECGVCNGGSAAAIALGFGTSARKIWLYDSFQGMPPTGPLDGEDAKAWVGRCIGSPDKVKEAFKLTRLPASRLEIRKGWFADTFCAPLPEQVAFLHIDADWYDSVSLALATFYGRIPAGGVIALDDFGDWEGCREAFYDFCHEQKIKPLLERCGPTQGYWIKSKSHNRPNP